MAGCVLGLVLSGFGAAFSSAIFDEVNLDRYVSIGRGTQAVAIFVAGFAHVFFSDMGLGSVLFPTYLQVHGIYAREEINERPD